MKSIISLLAMLTIAGALLTSCSQDKTQSLEEMLKDPHQQEKAFAMMAEDHELSKKYMAKMMDNDHMTGMMVDQLVQAAADDTLLAGKLSNMITNFPDLMLLTMHHFMPVIDADTAMCDGFCEHAMEHSNIAEGMCHSMKEHEEMNCCH
jgi:hypothetical protein